MKKKLTAVVLILTFMLASLVSGCGNNNEPQTKAPEGTDNPPEATVRDTLRIAVPNDIGDLSPHGLVSPKVIKMKVQMYETLFYCNFEDNAVMPQLATGYEWLDDTSLKITLREGVQFHNGYGEMKAEDVMFSLETVKASTANYPLLEVNFDKSEIVDDYTIILRTDKPYSPLLSNLTYCSTAIFSKTGYEADNGSFATDIGTGAYVLTDWKEGESMTMVAFEDYWEGTPKIKKLEWKVIDGETGRAMELETGGCDLAYTVSVIDKDMIEDAGNEFVSFFTNDTCTLHFNMDNEIFHNEALRKAFAYAYDRTKCAAVSKNDTTIVMPLYLDMNHPYAYKSIQEVEATGSEVIEFDLEKAKALFEEAGYFDPNSDIYNHEFVFEYFTPSTWDALGEAWASDLNSIGVKLKVEGRDFPTYVNDIKVARNFELCTWGTAPVTGDWEYFALHYYGGSPSTINISQSKDPEFDALVEEYRATSDDAKRREIALEAQKILYDKCYSIPSLETIDRYAHVPNLHGFEEGAFQSPVLKSCYFA